MTNNYETQHNRIVSRFRLWRDMIMENPNVLPSFHLDGHFNFLPSHDPFSENLTMSTFYASNNDSVSQTNYNPRHPTPNQKKTGWYRDLNDTLGIPVTYMFLYFFVLHEEDVMENKILAKPTIRVYNKLNAFKPVSQALLILAHGPLPEHKFITKIIFNQAYRAIPEKFKLLKSYLKQNFEWCNEMANEWRKPAVKIKSRCLICKKWYRFYGETKNKTYKHIENKFHKYKLNIILDGMAEEIEVPTEIKNIIRSYVGHMAKQTRRSIKI